MKRTKLNGPRSLGIALPILLLASVLCAPRLFAQELVESGIDPKLRMELDYARALKSWGLPDFAMKVLDRLEGRDPRVKIIIEIIELESLIAVGKWDEAKAIIAAKPDQDSQGVWAMKLTMADGYFAWGRYPEAQGIYHALFQKYPKGPSAELNDFYMNSAYKYSQMLLLMGKEREALAAYDNVLKAKLPKHVRRQVISEMAELMVKLAEQASSKPGKEVEVTVKDPRTNKDKKVKQSGLSERADLFARIDKLTTEILWEQDVWFGKAIVILAYRKKIEGDIKGAMALVDEYKQQLKDIDRVLKENEESTGEPLSKLSPMAQCRYMIGVILQDEAQKLIESGGDVEQVKTYLAGEKNEDGGRKSNGALQHFINVFIGYPETSWAPDAGVRAKQVENLLITKFGAKINTNVTDEKMERVRRSQFQNARTLLNQQQFANAADAYEKVLNLFPEEEQSVAALGELSRCYLDLQQDMNVDVVTRYLAERFSANDELMVKAGDQILRTAESYAERNIFDRKELLYNLYFDYFAEHPLAPAMMFRLAEDRFREERYQEANQYYERLTGTYSNAPSFSEALNKIAYGHAKLQDDVAEIKALDRYVKYLETQKKPGHALINAKFRMAAAYKRLGDKYTASAYNRFLEIVNLLSAEGHPYNIEPGDAEKNGEILEASMFFKAVCLAQIKKDGKEDTYRTMAIKSLEELLTTFPKSHYAPSALSQIGTLYSILGDDDATTRTLRRLKKDHPDSPEAKNVDFVLGMSLLEMGSRQAAMRSFRNMFAGGGKYTPGQIMMAGQKLAEAGEYDIAMEAFDKVLAASDDRAVAEPAMLGKGEALIANKQFDAGAKILETMLETFPSSGYTIPACLQLSRAYSELGSKEADGKKRFDIFNLAVKAMQRARKFEKTPGGLARLDLEIARINVRKAQAEEQGGNSAKAVLYRKEAIAVFQTLILLGDSNSAEVRPHMEEAFRECLPLMLQIERWQDVIETGEQYLETYPNGRYVSEIRSAMSRAKVKTATTAAESAPSTTETGE